MTAPDRSNSLDLAATECLAKALGQVGPGVGALSFLHDGANFCVGGDVRGFRDATDPERYILDLAESAQYLRHHLALVGRTDPLIADDAIARLHQRVVKT